MASVGTITVELNLDASKLTSGLKSAMSSLDSFGNKTKGIEGSFKGLGSSITSSLGSIGKTAGFGVLAAGAAATTVAVGGLTAGVVESVNTFKTFEQAVTNTASVTGKTGAEFESAKQNIQDVAKALGKDTVFSAQEAAEAMYTLASAGVDVSSMTTGQLKPALDLAAGTQEDLTKTMETMVAVSSQFGIEFEDSARVADVFATAIGQSQATMDKLAYSFNYVGPVAQAAGMSFEKTTASLSVLYDNGLKGQQAGTGLRGVIASLAKPTDKAAGVLARLGLTVEDVNPATQDLGTVMGKLQERGMTTADAFTLFNRTAAPAALILAKNSGAIADYTTKLEAAGGTASSMAAQQMDTLAGSMEKLGGSIENLKISVGEALAPLVRNIADTLDAAMPSIEKFTVGVVDSFLEMGGKLGSSMGAIKNIGETIVKIFNGVFAEISGTGMGTELIHAVNLMFTGIADTIENAAPTIETAIKVVLNIIRDTIAGLGPTLDNLKTIGSNIITVIKTVFSGISAESGKGVASGLSGVINTISGVLASLSTIITGKLVVVIPIIKKIFADIVAAVSWFASQFDGQSLSVQAKFLSLSLTFMRLKQELSPAINAIKDTLKLGIDSIKGAVGEGDIWGTLRTTFENLPQILSDAVTKLQPVWDVLNAVFVFGAGVIKGFADNIGPTWDNLKVIFESAVSIIKTIGGDIAKAISDLFKSFSGGEGGAGGAGASVGATIAGVINTISGAIAGLMKWFSENPKILEFGLALAGIAAAAISIVVPLAGIITAIGGVVGSIAGVIGFFGTFGLSLSSVGTLVGLVVSTYFPAFAAALATIGGAVGTVAGAILPALSAAFGVVVTVITFITGTVIPGIIAVLSAIGAPILIIIGVIALLAIAWTQNWGDIQGKAAAAVSFLDAQWEALKAAFGQIGPAFTAAAAELGQVWEGIKTSVSTAFAEVVTILTLTWARIKEVFGVGVDLVSATLDGWYATLQGYWDQIGASLDTFALILTMTWEKIKGLFSLGVDAVKAVLDGWYASLQGVWDQVGASLDTFSLVLTMTWEKIKGLFSVGVDAVKAVLQGWYDSLQGVWTQIQTAFQSLQTTLQAAWDALKAAFQAAVDSIKATIDGWKASLDAVWEQIKAGFESFKTTLLAGWEALKAGIKVITDGVKAGLDIFHSALEAIYKAEVAGYNVFKAAMLAAWEIFKAGVKTVTDAIKAVLDAFHQAGEAIYDKMVASYNVFKSAMDAAWNEFKAMVKTVTDAVKAQLDSWHNELVGIYNQAKTALTDLYTKVKSIWDQIVAAVKTKATELLNVIKKIPVDIKALATNFFNAGKAIMESLTKSVTEGLDKAKKKAEDGLAKIKKLLPNSPAKEGPFKELPYWGDVIPGPIEDSIRDAEKLISPLKSMLSSLKKPLDSFSAGSTTSPMNPLLDSVNKIEEVKSKFDVLNNVGFDGVNDSLQSMIDKMVEVVDTSDDMVKSMKSDSGFSLTSSINGNAGQGNFGQGRQTPQTNIKIGTQNNYKTGESARSLKNALASN